MMLARGTPCWIVAIPFLSMVSILLFVLWGPVHFIVISVILLVSFLPVMAFFRDPQRQIADGVVSPADGVVTRLEERNGRVYVSIFMNVHNVHVNRSPYDCRIMSIEHFRGGFVPAFNKDSDNNERVVYRFTADNSKWELVQIAGAVARRIVPYVEEGQDLARGERFGMIRFGSRVDLVFRIPRGMKIMVKEGDRVKAGSSSIAR